MLFKETKIKQQKDTEITGKMKMNGQPPILTFFPLEAKLHKVRIFFFLFLFCFVALMCPKHQDQCLELNNCYMNSCYRDSFIGWMNA